LAQACRLLQTERAARARRVLFLQCESVTWDVVGAGAESSADEVRNTFGFGGK
jgi:CBS-domain-containing membrane protein